MKSIPLTQGQVVLVDDVDYERLAGHKWFAFSRPNDCFYAVRQPPRANGPRRMIYMHRVILNPPEGLEVDHIDGDGLNNCRANLRLASDTLNSRNCRRRKPTRLGLPMGVAPVDGSMRNPFAARIGIRGRTVYLGAFPTAQEAHSAYLAARKRSLADAIGQMGKE